MLLQLIDGNSAVDSEGTKWFRHANGVWHRAAEEPPDSQGQIRLVVSEPSPADGPETEGPRRPQRQPEGRGRQQVSGSRIGYAGQ